MHNGKAEFNSIDLGWRDGPLLMKSRAAVARGLFRLFAPYADPYSMAGDGHLDGPAPRFHTGPHDKVRPKR